MADARYYLPFSWCVGIFDRRSAIVPDRGHSWRDALVRGWHGMNCAGLNDALVRCIIKDLSESKKEVEKTMTEHFTINLVKDSRAKFQVALASAGQNDQIIYHKGPFCAGPHKEDAMKASESGYVILVQKKLERFKFEYIAIRTKKKIR